MQNYMVQAQYGDQFEDVSVKARSPQEAIAKAKKMLAGTIFSRRFANFVV